MSETIATPPRMAVEAAEFHELPVDETMNESAETALPFDESTADVDETQEEVESVDSATATLEDADEPPVQPEIYDADESRLADHGLQYRHTDNINHWRKACIEEAGLREVVLSEEDYKVIGERIKDEEDAFQEAFPHQQVESVVVEEEEEEEKTPDPVELAENLRSAVMERNHERVSQLLSDPLLSVDSLYNPVLNESYIALLSEYYEKPEAPLLEGPELGELLGAVNLRHSVDEQLERLGAPDSNLTAAFKKLADQTAAHDLLTSNPPSMRSLRQLVAHLDPAADVYGREQELEQQKKDLNRVLESNDALRHQLHELEASICMIVANVRGMKEKADAKAEKEHKKELEHEIKVASSLANLSEHSAAADPSDTEEPTSITSCGSNLTLDRLNGVEERVPADHLLGLKIAFLRLLKTGVAGDSVRDVLAAKPNGQPEVAELQNQIRYDLGVLVDRQEIDEKRAFAEIFEWIVSDIRSERQRLAKCAEAEAATKKLMGDATKQANDLIKRIEAYRSYKDRCLKRMEGGIPDINVAELSKKAGKMINKLLNRKKLMTKPVEMSAEKMIKKNLLFMDDEITPKEVEKYTVRITPNAEEPGAYWVEAKLGGHVVKGRKITFEDLLQHEAKHDFRLEFDGPLVFDCLGFRRYLNRKFYQKNFV
ncbi:hypothetical protein M3Y99_00376500 [Aphelenchoides fujianensis]|nr:hypothetical protein M3Y99_00376500 [Aphelenchoides fujianensis]